MGSTIGIPLSEECPPAAHALPFQPVAHGGECSPLPSEYASVLACWDLTMDGGKAKSHLVDLSGALPDLSNNCALLAVHVFKKNNLYDNAGKSENVSELNTLKGGDDDAPTVSFKDNGSTLSGGMGLAWEGGELSGSIGADQSLGYDVHVYGRGGEVQAYAVAAAIQIDRSLANGKNGAWLTLSSLPFTVSGLPLGALLHDRSLVGVLRRALGIGYHPRVLKKILSGASLAHVLDMPGSYIQYSSPKSSPARPPPFGGGFKIPGGAAPGAALPSRDREDEFAGVEPDVMETMDVAIPKVALFVRVMSRINDNLYVGSKLIAKNDEVLDRYGITHILNCAGVIIPNYFPRRYQYKTLFLNDGKQQDVIGVLHEVLEYLDEVVQSGGRCLVHCEKGVSRSCTMVIAYLMWKRHETFVAISNEVKQLRPISQPNFGFTYQLLQWWNRLSKEIESPRLYRIVPDCRQRPQVTAARFDIKTAPTAGDLDVRGCFVLHTRTGVHVWCGERAHPMLVEGGKRHAERLRKFEGAAEAVVEVQGSESEEFWLALRGKGEVTEVARYNDNYSLIGAPSGPLLLRYPTWNISPLTKASLTPTCAFMLQNGMDLAVWIGEGVKGVSAAEIVTQFMEGRSYPPPGTPVAIQKPGEEEEWFLALLA